MVHMGRNTYTPKFGLRKVLLEAERKPFVQGITRLASEAKGLDPSMHTVCGSKMVNGMREQTLRFPEDVISIVLGKISTFY